MRAQTRGPTSAQELANQANNPAAPLTLIQFRDILTLNLEKGWFVGLSDYDWTFDWKDGGAATVPIGAQVGRVVHVGRQPISMSFQAGGNVAQPADRPKAGWILGFEFAPIYNFHLGPGND